MKQFTQMKWSVLFVAVVYANYVAYDQFFRPAPGPHWGKSDQARTPANMKEFTLPATEVAEDYFQFDKHNGYVTYDMDIEFWSDKGAKYFEKNGLEAIKKGLNSSFETLLKSKEDGGDKEVTLPSTAKSSVMKAMLNQFVYTIKVHKLIDANFEVDFAFSPRNNLMADYKEEMSTNQLVHLDNTQTLLEDLDKVGRTLPQKVLAANIPNTGHLYQYLGGAITLGAEVLDTSWKITQPIPKPKSNALKGFVRFRKYYRVNEPGQINLDPMFKGQKDLSINMTHFKKKEGFDSNYITVDVIYKFNLKDLIPKKDRAIVYYGELVSLDKSHDNIIKRIFQVFKKSNDIKTSDLYVEGQYKYRGQNKKFKTKINRIEYSFSKEEFKTNSGIRTRASNTSDEHQISQKVRKAIFAKESEDDLIDALKLRPLFTSEKI